MAVDRLYNIWSCMRQRCNNPKHTAAKWYYEKGIKLCDEWANSFSAFEKWSHENGYEESLSIDRIDSNKNYEPSNCRWITREENSRRAVLENRGNRKPYTRRKQKYVASSNSQFEAEWNLKTHGGENMSENAQKNMEQISEKLKELPKEVAEAAVAQYAARMEGFAEGFAAGEAHAKAEDK